VPASSFGGQSVTPTQEGRTTTHTPFAPPVPRFIRRRAASYRVVLLVAMTAGLAVVAAGCGGGSSGAKVAQVGTAQTTTTGAISSRDGKLEAGVRYAACMRQHGVPDFPDPDTSGTINASIPRNSPKFKAAERTCQHLLPGPSPQEQATYLQDALAYAKCMRGHGAPSFPDPHKGPDGGPEFPEIGPPDSSPHFKAAQRACHELLPGSPTGAP
jgi:hypothetical protein